MKRAHPATKRICLWSMPRCQSTALMYSFAQRSDTVVVDEPLYGYYLTETKAVRVGSEVADTLKAQSADKDEVLHNVMLREMDKPVYFIKNISKFIVNMDRDYLKRLLSQFTNIIMIREPGEVMISFAKGANTTGNAHLSECGIVEAHELFTLMADPIVVDSKDLLLDARLTLTLLCEKVGIAFEEGMLSWPRGGREEDGPWAPNWYARLHQSTGFETYKAATSNLLADVMKLPGMTQAMFDTACSLYEDLSMATVRRGMVHTHHHKQQLRSPHSNGVSPAKTQDLKPYLIDERNSDIKVWCGGRLVDRCDAKVSVFDGSVQGGDACWEGLRVHGGRVFQLEEHIRRMHRSAKALLFENVPSAEDITHAVMATLRANGMLDRAHIRLTLTRGEKITSGMSPAFNVFGCNLIVLAEFKDPVYDSKIKLVTASQRRNGPQCVDSKIHHNNMINNILAKIEANLHGADDAIMLDPEGFVSETNATNIFIVVDGKVFTPHADFCLPGITRQTVIHLAMQAGLPMGEKRISLSEVQTADEVFTTGTMGGITPVAVVDARTITHCPGPITRALQRLYNRKARNEGVVI